MEIEADRVLCETEKFDEPPALAIEVGDQRLVPNVQPAQRQHAMPMRGEAFGLANVPAAIGEMVRKGERPGRKFLEET